MKKKDDILMEEELEEEEESQVAASTDEEDEDSEPEKPRKPKTILVPKVQNMDDYLMKHYKNYIIQELNKRLVDGELTEIVGVPVKSEHIIPGECCFRRFSYWRLNQCDFLIDIELRVELRVETPAGVDTDFYSFYVELWFSFCEDEEECEFERIGLLESKPEHEGEWKLDKYLVPILRRDEIDEYAEEIWAERCPDAAKDQKLRRPHALTEKMHLSVISLPLHKRGDTKSIIFFHEGTVMIQPDRAPGEHNDPPPVEEHVPANTIVINTHTEGGMGNDLDIYHECIHYEWHYLFYRLQDMHNNDLKQLKKVRRSAIKDKDTADPTYFMEYQARYGSYGLLLPKSFMLETVDRLYKDAFEGKRKDGYYDHDGRRYEYVARKIADEYVISKASVRARMIQLGYIAALGALNFVDGHYIVPFAFSDIGSCSGDGTYVIDRKSVSLLYRKDKEFKRIMQSGKFAYVDGHVVYCESDNVIHTIYGARLSGWANAHIDRVSLRFSKTYTGDHRYVYTFGQMNSKEAVENAFKFLDLSGKMTIKDMQRAADRLVDEMPLSFHGALAYIMKGRCTVDELVGRIPISRSTLLRLRTEERKQYNLDQVVAICVGLHLPPWLSDILLDRAHLTVKRYGPLAYYGIILDCFYMDTIQDVQDFVRNSGFDPLQLNFDAE